MCRLFLWILIIVGLINPICRADVPLPPPDDSIPPVFKNMVVVQRQAMKKYQKIIFSLYPTLDFSDGPYTMYSLSADLGYGISPYWEIYFSTSPFFIANQRDTVKKIGEAVRESGSNLEIEGAKPKIQYGVAAIWTPIYGKDSWNSRMIIRSDTFFKFFGGMIQYEGNESGYRGNLLMGKTFYSRDLINFRLAAGGSYLQTVLQSQKYSTFVALFEFGLVSYF